MPPPSNRPGRNRTVPLVITPSAVRSAQPVCWPRSRARTISKDPKDDFGELSHACVRARVTVLSKEPFGSFGICATPGFLAIMPMGTPCPRWWWSGRAAPDRSWGEPEGQQGRRQFRRIRRMISESAYRRVRDVDNEMIWRIRRNRHFAGFFDAHGRGPQLVDSGRVARCQALEPALVGAAVAPARKPAGDELGEPLGRAHEPAVGLLNFM